MKTEKKLVKIRCTFVVEREYPVDWTKESIEFHCNESSSCFNNLLQEQLDKEECTCFGFEARAEVIE